MNIFWHIFSLFLLWNLLVFHGACETRPPTCKKKNFIKLLEDRWKICKVNEEKNLYYFTKKVNKHKKDICSLTVALLGKDKYSQTVNRTKPCEEDVMQLAENFEEQTVLDSGPTSENKPDVCNGDVKAILEDPAIDVCRKEPDKDDYVIKLPESGEECKRNIPSFLDLFAGEVPVCSYQPKEPAPCESKPCHNAGSCVEKDTPTRLLYVCICPPGYDPLTDCAKECPKGKWGEACKEKCGACAESTKTIQYKVIKGISLTPCDPQKGCRKCKPGVSRRPYCDEVTCREVVCRNNGRCENKHCTCAPGYSGVLCEKDIGVLRFKGCFKKEIKNEEYCRFQGECYQVKNRNNHSKRVCRCDEGFAGEFCEETCLEKTETCLYGSCVKRDQCECHTGFYGETCDSECPPGTWGEHCKERCGACKFFPCRNTDGRCPKGKCQYGYEPPTCQTKKRRNAVKGEIIFPVTMELESDSEDDYFDILDEDYSITKEEFEEAVKTFITKQLGDILPTDAATSKVDITLSPKVEPLTPESRVRRKTIARKTRQLKTIETVVVADITVVLSQEIVTNPKKFAAEMATSIKKNADDFDGHGFTIRTDSVQVTSLSIDASITSISGDRLQSFVKLAVAGGVFSAMAIVVLLGISCFKRKKRHGQERGRNNMVYMSNRQLPGYRSGIRSYSTRV